MKAFYKDNLFYSFIFLIFYDHFVLFNFSLFDFTLECLYRSSLLDIHFKSYTDFATLTICLIWEAPLLFRGIEKKDFAERAKAKFRKIIFYAWSGKFLNECVTTKFI